MEPIAGTVIRLGANVTTDQILPLQYHTESTGRAAKHLLEGLVGDGELAGGIIVADHQFGGGPGAAAVVSAIKAAGIAGVIASGFDRAFFRTAVNNGLPVVEAAVGDKIEERAQISIDLIRGTISTESGNIGFAPYPEYICRIFQAGSLEAATESSLRPSPES